MTEQQAAVSVVQLPLQTRRLTEQPRWEVRLDGVVIGWIQQERLRGASNVFYFATAVHPTTGRQHRLEGNIDFDERVQVILAFHRDPMSSEQHLGVWHPPGTK